MINRFSEGIDLSLMPQFLGLDEPEATAGLSKDQAHKWMERAEAKCTVVRDTLAPEIHSMIENQLGKAETPWLMFDVDVHSRSPLLLFYYPTTQEPAMDYVKRSVKLEFCLLTEQRPTARHAVRPCIADALDLRRSFWEKVHLYSAVGTQPFEGCPT